MDVGKVALGLQTYPEWIRVAMVVAIPLYALMYSLLFVLAPPESVEPLTFTDFRQAVNDREGMIDFSVRLVNNTGRTVPLRKAVLEVYKDSIPESGFLSVTELSAHIIITSEADTVRGVANGDEILVDASRPYAGNSYTKIEFPLNNDLEDGKADRLKISIKYGEFLDESSNTARLSIEIDENIIVEQTTSITR